jgi:hypothetical protein
MTSVGRVPPGGGNAGGHRNADPRIGVEETIAREQRCNVLLPVAARQADAEKARRHPHTSEVLRQAKDLAAVGAQGLEDTVPVEEATIEDADPRPAGGDQTPVHVHELRQGRLHAATAVSAVKNACAFKSVSSYSRAGTESATMPPPA